MTSPPGNLQDRRQTSPYHPQPGDERQDYPSSTRSLRLRRPCRNLLPGSIKVRKDSNQRPHHNSRIIPRRTRRQSCQHSHPHRCNHSKITLLGIDNSLTMQVARNTFAAITLSREGSLYVVSKALGHASTAVTVAIYGKYLKQSERKKKSAPEFTSSPASGVQGANVLFPSIRKADS